MLFSWKQTLQIDMLASMTSPTSSRDQLLCYILWMALVYTIDDIRDRFMTDEEDSINNHAVSIFFYFFLMFYKWGYFLLIFEFNPKGILELSYFSLV